MARAEARGLEVIDGTCTWVIQEQKELARLVDDGYTIVLLGTPNHPEVVGLLGFAPDAIVVDEEEDWERIPRRKRMALITQSTQPPWKFERLAAFLVCRAHELKIVNTVCPVTIRRQEDTTELAARRRPRGRRRRPQQRQHQGADAARGHRGQAGASRSSAPPTSTTASVFAGRAWSVSPAAPRRPSRTSRRSPAGSTSWPARRSDSAAAGALAHDAVTAVAEPAYRSTSLSRGRTCPAAAARRRRAGRLAPETPVEGLPVVAIVGRPNVGKSTLFNRIVGERRAIVEDRARTTRDRLYDVAEWNDRRFVVIDTGGLETRPGDAIEERVQDQARLAIEEADVIVFVVDAAAGLTPADQEAAELLRVAAAPLIVAVNKADNERLELEAAEFHAWAGRTRHADQRPPRARRGRPARRRRLGAAGRIRRGARAQAPARGRGRATVDAASSWSLDAGRSRGQPTRRAVRATMRYR